MKRAKPFTRPIPRCYPRVYAYGHELIQRIILRETSARVYMESGNVYNVHALPGQKFTTDDFTEIVATAIRKEKA